MSSAIVKMVGKKMIDTGAAPVFPTKGAFVYGAVADKESK
jgi:hypothetical protein